MGPGQAGLGKKSASRSGTELSAAGIAWIKRPATAPVKPFPAPERRSLPRLVDLLVQLAAVLQGGVGTAGEAAVAQVAQLEGRILVERDVPLKQHFRLAAVLLLELLVLEEWEGVTTGAAHHGQPHVIGRQKLADGRFLLGVG